MEDDIPDEIDFSGGERGKFAEWYAAGTNVVVLEPDIAEAFPDARSVNAALRLLVELARRQSNSARAA